MYYRTHACMVLLYRLRLYCKLCLVMLQFYGGGVGVIKLVVTIKVGSGRQVSVPYAFLKITPLQTSYEPHSRT